MSDKAFELLCETEAELKKEMERIEDQKKTKYYKVTIQKIYETDVFISSDKELSHNDFCKRTKWLKDLTTNYDWDNIGIEVDSYTRIKDDHEIKEIISCYGEFNKVV